jgi:uncharacterized membrane protein
VIKIKRVRTKRIFVCALAVLLLLTAAACQSPGPETPAPAPGTAAEASAAPEGAETAEPQEISPGGGLVIPVAEITETAAFFPVIADGARMEVLAVLAPDGTIRTAFNTCQICYDSGRGYYEQAGETLVCQNCGNRFRMSQVETVSGGCNPWPIFAGDKTVTDESITISYDFLLESKDIFAQWKTTY